VHQVGFITRISKRCWPTYLEVSTSGSGKVSESWLCNTVIELLVTWTHGIPSLAEQLLIVEEYSLPWSESVSQTGSYPPLSVFFEQPIRNLLQYLLYAHYDYETRIRFVATLNSLLNDFETFTWPNDKFVDNPLGLWRLSCRLTLYRRN
jgi:hypothetical protein